MIPMKEIPVYSRRYYEIVLNRFLSEYNDNPLAE